MNEIKMSEMGWMGLYGIMKLISLVLGNHDDEINFCACGMEKKIWKCEKCQKLA
jgi:hypothetical protein